MAMAAYVKLILGSVAFSIFWVLAVFPTVPLLPIGRAAGSLLGGILMVIFQILTVDQAYQAIDLSILVLLFGTMVVSGYLERADAFKYLGKLLTWKSKGAKDLICRICLISAISSALFTNDTSCMVLTEFVLKIARQNHLPPQPFLLALASSANIGSTATPIGNPQNLVIATQNGVSFGEFLIGILPAAVVGLLCNALLLIFMYGDLLSVKKGQQDSTVAFNGDGVDHQLSPATMSHVETTNVDSVHHESLRNRVNSKQAMGAAEVPWSLNGAYWDHRNQKLWKSCVYIVVVGMLVSLLMGFNMSGTAITAALALMILDFKDAVPCLEKVKKTTILRYPTLF
ncbi:hypothetical protein ERO13_A11G011000v2 [Gossypium hirsutum]|nr:hypothetical protein ERO13_A11G011000v2 [Gossypium hirsutum]